MSTSVSEIAISAKPLYGINGLNKKLLIDLSLLREGLVGGFGGCLNRSTSEFSRISSEMLFNKMILRDSISFTSRLEDY